MIPLILSSVLDFELHELSDGNAHANGNPSSVADRFDLTGTADSLRQQPIGGTIYKKAT